MHQHLCADQGFLQPYVEGNNTIPNKSFALYCNFLYRVCKLFFMSLSFCFHAVCTTSMYNGAKAVLILRKDEEKSELNRTFLSQKKYDNTCKMISVQMVMLNILYIRVYDVHGLNCVPSPSVVKSFVQFFC